ncbi:MAG TPA: 4Fe-4S ferredoxin [Deltaproteobacteria bacterium]|nr:4Fe-4S ferredoxin [Deltaproteobacteria bacterium]
MRFALKIDHERCWGCKACEVACKQEKGFDPGVSLIRVKEEGPFETKGSLTFTFRPVLCRHCDNPPCADVCPVGAIAGREDGIVLLDHERCTGCAQCVAACPYNAISMDPRNGVAQKCDMCHARVENGLVPACADNVCLAHCIYFGDANRINEMMQEKAWLKYRMQGNLGDMVITVEE